MYDEGFRKAALQLYDYFKNMKKVAEALNIGVATIWRWKTISIESRMTNRKNTQRKFTTYVLEFVKQVITRNGTLTINEISFEIRKRFNLLLSRQAVALAIQKLGFSRKRISKRGYIRNKELYDVKLKDFKDSFLTLTDSISVDESGYEVHYQMFKSTKKTVISSYGYKRKRRHLL